MSTFPGRPRKGQAKTWRAVLPPSEIEIFCLFIIDAFLEWDLGNVKRTVQILPITEGQASDSVGGRWHHL